MYLWFVDIGLSLPMLGVPRRPPDWLRLQGVSNSIEQAGWWLLTQLLYVSVTVAVGTLAAMVVERPFLALRERWFPSRAEIAP
jgi:peptidoglycan/LPS O-acetylase OafA/YrhL